MTKPHDRPSANPGGIECVECGVIFIGEEWHSRCAVCEEKSADSNLSIHATPDAMAFANAMMEMDGHRLENVLEYEKLCRDELNTAREQRSMAERSIAFWLDRICDAKRDLYRLGFTGNIMRSPDGERVTGPALSQGSKP